LDVAQVHNPASRLPRELLGASEVLLEMGAAPSQHADGEPNQGGSFTRVKGSNPVLMCCMSRGDEEGSENVDPGPTDEQSEYIEGLQCNSKAFPRPPRPETPRSTRGVAAGTEEEAQAKGIWIEAREPSATDETTATTTPCNEQGSPEAKLDKIEMYVPIMQQAKKDSDAAQPEDESKPASPHEPAPEPEEVFEPAPEASAKAEEERIAAEKKAEEERLVAEAAAKAEEERIAAEKKAEEDRLAAEAAARGEEERIAAEKKAEEEKLAAEAKKAEEAERLAEQERLAEERLARERAKREAEDKAKREAEEKRLAEEQAEEKRLAEEEAKRAAEEEERRAEEERQAEEKRLAQEAEEKRRAEEEVSGECDPDSIHKSPFSILTPDLTTWLKENWMKKLDGEGNSGMIQKRKRWLNDTDTVFLTFRQSNSTHHDHPFWNQGDKALLVGVYDKEEDEEDEEANIQQYDSTNKNVKIIALQTDETLERGKLRVLGMHQQDHEKAYIILLNCPRRWLIVTDEETKETMIKERSVPKDDPSVKNFLQGYEAGALGKIWKVPGREDLENRYVRFEKLPLDDDFQILAQGDNAHATMKYGSTYETFSIPMWQTVPINKFAEISKKANEDERNQLADELDKLANARPFEGGQPPLIMSAITASSGTNDAAVAPSSSATSSDAAEELGADDAAHQESVAAARPP